jgi:hypothetical protein
MTSVITLSVAFLILMSNAVIPSVVMMSVVARLLFTCKGTGPSKLVHDMLSSVFYTHMGVLTRPSLKLHW